MLRATLRRPAILKRAQAAALGFASFTVVALNSSAQTRLEQDARELQARSNVFQGAGARAYGMGGAFLARPDDATAASWNPAGLSYLRSPELSLVGISTSLRIVQRDISRVVRREETLSGRAPDFAAATTPISLGSLTGAVQLSFQRVLSFSGKRTIETIDPDLVPPVTVRQFDTLGGFDVVALASGLQVSRQLRFGISLNRWLNGYSYSSERVGRNPSQQTTDFDFSGWNVNLGGIWSPIEQLNLGAVYKNGFTADVDLARSRVDPARPDLNLPAATNSHRRGDVRLDFPAAFGFGASWRPMAQLTLSTDYTRTNWSEGRIRNYFTLPREGTPAEPDDLFRRLPYPTLDPKRSQADSEQLRTGLEYVLIKGRVRWPLRVGYFSDWQLETRINQDVGGVDRRPLYHGFTAGTGLIVGRVLADVAYMFETGRYVDSDIEGTDPLPRSHSVRSHRVFVSFIYRHKR
jgi:long-chain fatty acid transport protein